MAKRIEFTPGIEAMRGSFSPRQKLLYALNDNPAFEAPVGRQYARNYQANFIGAKRSATGLKYFFTKTKSATLVTPASKQRMAITGGAGAIYAAILDAPTMRARLEYSWKNYFKSPKTFRAWCFVYLTDMLTRKAKNIQMGHDAQGELIYVGNPWNTSTTTSYIPAISNEVLVKFWLQLGSDGTSAAPIYFTVEGQKGIGFAGLTWESETFGKINVLNLDMIEVGSVGEERFVVGYDSAVYGGRLYLQLNAAYVDSTAAIVADGKYITTDVAPE